MAGWFEYLERHGHGVLTTATVDPGTLVRQIMIIPQPCFVVHGLDSHSAPSIQGARPLIRTSKNKATLGILQSALTNDLHRGVGSLCPKTGLVSVHGCVVSIPPPWGVPTSSHDTLPGAPRLLFDAFLKPINTSAIRRALLTTPASTPLLIL